MATLAGNNPITANGVYTLATYLDKEHSLQLSGTPNGATVKLEYVNLNGSNTEYDSTNTTFSNSTGSIVFLATAETMQLNVTGAGASTNIAVQFRQL